MGGRAVARRLDGKLADEFQASSGNFSVDHLQNRSVAPFHYATPPGVTPRLIRDICELRASRADFLPPKLLSPSAWDILLHLYARHLDQTRTSISALTAETGIPATSVLRWLGSLTSGGLVTRSDDPVDARRVFVELSPAGVVTMNRFFAVSGARAIFL